MADTTINAIKLTSSEEILMGGSSTAFSADTAFIAKVDKWGEIQFALSYAAWDGTTVTYDVFARDDGYHWLLSKTPTDGSPKSHLYVSLDTGGSVTNGFAKVASNTTIMTSSQDIRFLELVNTKVNIYFTGGWTIVMDPSYYVDDIYISLPSDHNVIKMIELPNTYYSFLGNTDSYLFVHLYDIESGTNTVTKIIDRKSFSSNFRSQSAEVDDITSPTNLWVAVLSRTLVDEFYAYNFDVSATSYLQYSHGVRISFEYEFGNQISLSYVDSDTFFAAFKDSNGDGIMVKVGSASSGARYSIQKYFGRIDGPTLFGSYSPGVYVVGGYASGLNDAANILTQAFMYKMDDNLDSTNYACFDIMNYIGYIYDITTTGIEDTTALINSMSTSPLEFDYDSPMPTNGFTLIPAAEKVGTDGLKCALQPPTLNLIPITLAAYSASPNDYDSVPNMVAQ